MKELKLYLCSICGETRGEFRGETVLCECDKKRNANVERIINEYRRKEHISSLDTLAGV